MIDQPLSHAFAVFTPLMKSRDARAGWFAFATCVDTMQIVRWRVHRQMVSEIGAKPRERLVLDEARCGLRATDEAWTRPELVGYPASIEEAGAMTVARFERLTTFRLESEVPG